MVPMVPPLCAGADGERAEEAALFLIKDFRLNQTLPIHARFPD